MESPKYKKGTKLKYVPKEYQQVNPANVCYFGIVEQVADRHYVVSWRYAGDDDVKRKRTETQVGKIDIYDNMKEIQEITEAEFILYGK
jgi:hypothetical protein